MAENPSSLEYLGEPRASLFQGAMLAAEDLANTLMGLVLRER